MKIIVGGRRSASSLIHCKLVAQLLSKAGAEVELRSVDTAADSLEASLNEGGGSEIFVKEVDDALVRGDIDVAVLDMTDVGPTLPRGVSVAAVPARDEVRDAYVSTKASKLLQLPKGARVGVTSQVAHVQLARLNPILTIIPMPPDVEALLRSLKAGELDAFIVAACDLMRMKFSKLIAELIGIDKMIPAVGQGALSVQVRSAEKDLMKFVAKACHHRASGLRVRAERGFLKAVGGLGGAVCAAHAEIKPSGIAMVGFISTADGSEFVSDKETGALDKPADVGIKLANKILKKFSA